MKEVQMHLMLNEEENEIVHKVQDKLTKKNKDQVSKHSTVKYIIKQYGKKLK